jgi:hypothetical protein
MSQHSDMEWTDTTWNPVRGLAKITPGCDHRNAETFGERFWGVKGHPYKQGFDRCLVPEELAQPALAGCVIDPGANVSAPELPPHSSHVLSRRRLAPSGARGLHLCIHSDW